MCGLVADIYVKIGSGVGGAGALCGIWGCCSDFRPQIGVHMLIKGHVCKGSGI